MVSDTLDKFKSVRGPRSCGTLSIRGKRRGGLIEKLENLNTLVKTNGEGRAKEEDKGGAKCESSISMGTFAFRLNFWRSTLLFDICLSSANTPQTIRFLSLSLSLTIYHFFYFFRSLTRSTRSSKGFQILLSKSSSASEFRPNQWTRRSCTSVSRTRFENRLVARSRLQQ